MKPNIQVEVGEQVIYWVKEEFREIEASFEMLSGWIREKDVED